MCHASSRKVCRPDTSTQSRVQFRCELSTLMVWIVHIDCAASAGGMACQQETFAKQSSGAWKCCLSCLRRRARAHAAVEFRRLARSRHCTNLIIETENFLDSKSGAANDGGRRREYWGDRKKSPCRQGNNPARPGPQGWHEPADDRQN